MISTGVCSVGSLTQNRPKQFHGSFHYEELLARKLMVISLRQCCCFTYGAQILVRQPLFYTVGMKIMPTFQCPKIISIFVFLLHIIIHNNSGKEKKTNTYPPPPTWVKLVTLTWQTQQGSPSSGDPIAIEYCRCLKWFNIVSSLNPVLTFPMRSSSANNSYNSNTHHITRIRIFFFLNKK